MPARDYVFCVLHDATEARSGRVWGRDGHLGTNQVRVLAWLAIARGTRESSQVVQLSGSGPLQGWRALSQLIDVGCIRVVSDDPEMVTITPMGRRSVEAYPETLAVFPRSAVRLDGRPLRRRNRSGRALVSLHAGMGVPKLAGTFDAAERRQGVQGAGGRA